MYVNSINYFRGIAIIFIVFGHCLVLSDFNYESIFGKTIHNLTQGGTTFFVFISGFLFHHIFFKKFEYKRFLNKKIKYVLYPYIVLSIIPIIIRVSFPQVNILSAIIPQTNNRFIDYMISIGMYYMTGDTITAYWYIPFIMIVFLMSPIFMRFIRLKIRAQLGIISLLLICSILVHRGVPRTSFAVLQNVFYFLPIYLIGILSSAKKEVIYRKLKGKEFFILGFVIVLAVLQTYSGQLGNYAKTFYSYGGIDLILIQKIIFSFGFMIWLNRFENKKFEMLGVFAENSFGIFFTHGLIISIIMMIKNRYNFSFPLNSFWIYLMVSSMIFFLSLAVTMLIKKITPKYSRNLIGS